MATLATQAVSRAGIVPTFAAAAGGGDKFSPDKDTWIEAVNGSGGSITVTIVTPKNTSYGAAIADIAVAVAAGTTRKIGPFPREHFADTDDGLADITYSATGSLTVGVFSLSEA